MRRLSKAPRPDGRMTNKLTSSDRRIILIAIAVAAISLAIGIKYFARAFPEATLRLQVNKPQAVSIAERFLAARGFNLRGYHQAAIFQYDDDAKLYLERTQGLAKMNQLTRGPVHLWRWTSRWFRPQQKEEFRADVTPAGQVVGFEHEIPEAAPGANLDQATARALAEQFLAGVMHRNVSGLEFVEGASEKRPARTDYTFTWKDKNVNLGDGSYRLTVDVDGNQIAGYNEFVKVPEDWQRGYEELRSRNTSAQLVDEVLFVLLTLALVIILVRRLRDRDVPLRLAVGFGAVAAVLYFLGQLNEFSIEKFGYATTSSYSSFIGGYFWEAALSSLGIGAFIFILVAGSEPVYRQGLPGLTSIRRTLSWSGLRSRPFFMANVVGISMTFFFFAYQTVFYLAANKLGAWAPSDIPFSNLLNTSIPWVAVLFMGFFPAVSEEMQFRAFAIPFLRKTFRSLPAGLIGAAFIWGFLHSAYPNQPFFIRGLEVGLGGIIIGLVMLRFGIFATMIWHYSVDALYTAFLLLRSHNSYLMVSGGVTAGIMLVPLAVALAAYLKTGTFSDEAPLTNEAAGVSRAAVTEARAAEEARLGYRRMSNRRLVAAGIVILIALAIALLPAYRFGKGIKLRESRTQAERLAANFLRTRGVNPANYHVASWLYQNTDPSALRYLFQRRSVEQADQLYRRATREVVWEVRFFRPLQKEEYRIFVDPNDARVFAFRHLLDEDAPGASLAPGQAQALAEKFMQGQGYDLADFRLQNTEANKRKARVDYTLTWQVKPGDPRNVDQAHYRVTVDVAGDQVVGMARFFKLPEDWLRERESSRLVNMLLYALEGLLGAGFIAGFIMLLVRQIRAGKIRWKPAALVGAALAVGVLLEELTRIPVLYQRYETSVSMANFWIMASVSLIVGPLFLGLLGWLLVALATSLYGEAWQIFRGRARAVWRHDAVVAVLVGLVAGAALVRFDTFFSDHFHKYAPVQIGIFPSLADATYPGVAMFLHALFFSVLYAGGVALVVYALRRGWEKKAWWLWAGLLLVLVSLGPAGAHSLREYFAGWVLSFVPLAAASALIWAFFRSNILAYITAAFCLEVAAPVVYLLSQPAAFFKVNGAVLILLTVALVGWLLSGRERGTAG
jgi:membrane protease YdiL (CAAX protease family)